MNCIACDKPALGPPHHVIYEQEIRHWKGDVTDQRNLVPVCTPHHANHHGYARVFRLDELPDSVFEFATELMGPGPAYEYLRRHYGGEDPRLEAVLADWEAAR